MIIDCHGKDDFSMTTCYYYGLNAQTSAVAPAWRDQFSMAEYLLRWWPPLFNALQKSELIFYIFRLIKKLAVAKCVCLLKLDNCRRPLPCYCPTSPCWGSDPLPDWITRHLSQPFSKESADKREEKENTRLFALKFSLHVSLNIFWKFIEDKIFLSSKKIAIFYWID